jgi:aubergine-like protein
MVVKAALAGLVVMSNYGKTNYYTITDIQYNDLESVVFDGSQVKLVDYYKDKYQVTIKSLRQPLLVAENKKKDRITLLVPELMLMTGIPEDFDEMRRKKISEFTIRPPGEKHNEIGGLMRKLKNVDDLATLDKMGIKVNQNMEDLKAKIIPSPILELGRDNSVDRGKEACFNLFNKPIFASKHPINLAVIFQRGTDVRMVLDTFSKTSTNLGVTLRINKYEIDRMGTERIDKEMDSAIEGGDNICCIIIPNNLKTQYRQIKTSAICKRQIVTQVFTDVKLRNKNIQSIATKVLLQIIAKRGNTLWVPKPTCKIDGCMLVAFDNAKVGAKNVLGLCATINSTYSSIFSATASYDSNQNRFGKMVELAIASINAYLARNTRLPKEVVMFQNSCTGDQVSLFHEFFIEPLKAKIQEIFHERVNLTMIMINVKTSERFFVEDGRGVGNVEAGTLVSSGLVSLNYDFYIVSQRSNRGCSVPNHYRVIYSSSEVEEGVLQEIAFSQCFNYVNWTGSIKVPAIMQYAKKLAKFNSEVLTPDTEIAEGLASKLYDHPHAHMDVYGNNHILVDDCAFISGSTSSSCFSILGS